MKFENIKCSLKLYFAATNNCKLFPLQKDKVSQVSFLLQEFRSSKILVDLFFLLLKYRHIMIQLNNMNIIRTSKYCMLLFT